MLTINFVDEINELSKFVVHGNTSFFDLVCPHITTPQDAKQGAKFPAKRPRFRLKPSVHGKSVLSRQMVESLTHPLPPGRLDSAGLPMNALPTPHTPAFRFDRLPHDSDSA